MKQKAHEMSHYFNRDADFITPKREKLIIKEIKEETGFIAKKIIHSSLIYNKKKVKDLVYEGRYKGRRAILKVQGIEPQYHEPDLIRAFERQNRSKLIVAPKIYRERRWNKQRRYGYFIMEYIEGKPIYKSPLATKSEMKNFCRFYQEFHTKALRRPLFKIEGQLRPGALGFESVEYWRRMCEDTGRLKLEDYAPYLMRYYPLIQKHAKDIPMVFTNADLFPSHVFKLKDGRYAMIDFMSFRYVRKWVDLTMNVWNAWMEIKDSNFTIKSLIKLVEEWKRAYKQIPTVKKDKHFDHTFYTLMLNRSIGTILADLGAAAKWGEKKNERLLKNNIKIHQKLFDYFAEKMEETHMEVESKF